MAHSAVAQGTWEPGELDTVNAVLARSAAQFADRTWLEYSGAAYSYAQVLADAQRLARGLRALGVQKGDTVASILDNNYDCALAWLAINQLGAISAPVNTAFKGEFLRHQITDCSAKIVIAETDYAERVADIAGALPLVHTVLYRGDRPKNAAATGKAFEPLEDYKRAGDPIDVKVAPGDLAMLIYTAGTTGPSKGCMISHNYACNLARQSKRSSGRTMDDIVWTPLPFFHFNATAACTLSTGMVGGQVSIYPRFSLSNFWPEIERTKANVANLLGSMIPLIAQAADTEVSKRCYGQLRAATGAPFPAELQKIWRERFGVERCGSGAYGFTEACLLTSITAGEYMAPGSSGKRNDDFDVRIVDDNDVELPPNTPGEIICRPKRPHVMFEGYWNRPADTLKIMKNLWLHTGDIGKFDEDGFFFFLDRKKDYLRRRGENISSFEMETAFRAHEGIEDVAVHAVLSDVGEDDVKVTAILKSGVTLTEEELCVWCLDKVPYFAVPRYIEFRAELPRNPVGRVLKYELRDQGCTPTTWDREKSSLQLAKR